MGIKQLYNDNLRKLPNEYGDVSVMVFWTHQIVIAKTLNDLHTTTTFEMLSNIQFSFWRKILFCILDPLVKLHENFSKTK